MERKGWLMNGRKVAVGVAAGAVSVITVVGGMAPASASGAAEKPSAAAQPSGRTIGTFAGNCLDVEGASRADRAPIIQYRCHNGANQRFTFQRVGNNVYKIRTFAGKCLDVEGASRADRARIIQYGCHNGANQRFRFTL